MLQLARAVSVCLFQRVHHSERAASLRCCVVASLGIQVVYLVPRVVVFCALCMFCSEPRERDCEY